jgi:beta-phosphoglucomutase-like phosphatase (HAD superfamily)
MSCDAIIFDVDGTLADTEDAHRRAFNLAFREFDLDWSWDAALYEELLKVTGGKERLGSYVTTLDVPTDRMRHLHSLVPDLHRAKTRLYGEIIKNGAVPLRAGVRRLLAQARDAGLLLAIASTTSAENIAPLLEASLGPNGVSWFATIATGDVVPNKKPAPDIYNVALTTLGLAPGHAIAIEDSAIGVRSAKAAGLYTVATPSTWTRSQDFGAADLLLDSLDELLLEQLLVLHAASRLPSAHTEEKLDVDTH